VKESFSFRLSDAGREADTSSDAPNWQEIYGQPTVSPCCILKAHARCLQILKTLP
jgi:hypothetical protein